MTESRSKMAASMSSTSSLTNSLAAIANTRTSSQPGKMWTTYVQCCTYFCISSVEIEQISNTQFGLNVIFLPRETLVSRVI